MKLNKIILVSLIIFAIVTGSFMGDALAGEHDCDCDGECSSSDDCCGCSTGNQSVYCDECESNEDCVYGETVIYEDGISYPAYCKKCSG